MSRGRKQPQVIHLLELIIIHNRSAREQSLRIMDDIMSSLMNIHDEFL